MLSSDMEPVVFNNTNIDVSDRTAPIRVLVVDDDHNSVVMVSRLLKTLGLRVDAANGSLAAIQCIRQSQYDLVVTDLQMPVMDGFELAVWIKQGSEQIPVIIMTERRLSEIEKKMHAGKVDAWLFKPCHSPELRNTLRKLRSFISNRPETPNS